MSEFHTKICTKCGVEQHLYFFRFDPLKGSYASWCQYCIAIGAVVGKEYASKPQDDGSTKICIDCGEPKPISEYYFDRSRNKHFNKCKSCEGKRTTNNMFRRKYGVDMVWREETMAAQDNKCAICKIPFNDTNFKPNIDHDASNGKVRALLCSACNLLLGVHQHNSSTLRQAGFDRHAEYIEHYKRIHEIKLVG